MNIRGHYLTHRDPIKLNVKHRAGTAVIVEFKQKNLGLMQSRYRMANLTSAAILINVSSVKKRKNKKLVAKLATDGRI